MRKRVLENDVNTKESVLPKNRQHPAMWVAFDQNILAERGGFEPPIPFQGYSLSKRAH